jgi:3-oxoacyl-(acyl-carrier-protein) synthase
MTASIYIAGMGVISALGRGVINTIQALETNWQALQPVTLFPVSAAQLLNVGMVDLVDAAAEVPRTHQLARIAAEQALAQAGQAPPDAIVVGSTTGGILTTEALLEKGAADPQAYACHGVGSVAEDLARRYGCKGPVLTVSTACSSGAVAIKLALEMLRSGRFTRVLVGGADSLSRLTYFGFKSLQLIDPEKARPMDRDRRGMSVAEGAAMLLLTTEAPERPQPQILGAGLSCDAYHATAPHPDGAGALAAMQAALNDAGLTPAAIDYINLHGTGTRDNDLAEAKAVHTLFGAGLPPLSSTKGATGHTLAAAGAIEAVIAAAGIQHGIAPGNAGFSTPDPDLNLTPLRRPLKAPLGTVLSNSFGFGGNNAALIVGRSRPASAVPVVATPAPLIVRRTACISGVGHAQATRDAFRAARSCGGCLDDAALSEGLPPRMIRRLKRLPKLALALASRTCQGATQPEQPAAVCLGTGWGALSETCDFLKRLVDTDQAYPSPTDFVGSVHNAPAGQIAMLLGAKGANITTSGGDYSFEQALWSADLISGQSAESVLVLGVDENHALLSPLFDASVRAACAPADGGGALLLQRDAGPGVALALLDYRSGVSSDGMAAMIERLGGAPNIRDTYAAVLAGCPAAHRRRTDQQLTDFMTLSRFEGPVIDYRRFSGEFAAASAVAAVMGVDMVREGIVPAAHAGGADVGLNGKSILLLGLGPYMTAVRIFAQ